MRISQPLPVLITLVAVACGGTAALEAVPPASDGGSSGHAGPEGGSSGQVGPDGATADSASGDAGGTPDPEADGPFPFAEKNATTTIASTGDSVAIHAVYPTGAGSFPVVVIGHGFQLPPSQYYGYARRLASFGYVALTVDFPTSFAGNDNPKQAKDMIGGLDWAKADATFGAKVDLTKAAMTGHSLGGKLALLAATLDPRVSAVFVLDPVDGGGPGACNPPACVTVATLLPTLKIPTGFIGETTDATGAQACAPMASNFQTFYAQASTPSLEVTAAGANHMSFLDDVSTCGFVCSFCKAATASNAQINGMARAFMIAFYERNLRGNAAYDAYLTGAQAQARYVTTSRATIGSK